MNEAFTTSSRYLLSYRILPLMDSLSRRESSPKALTQAFAKASALSANNRWGP